MKKNLLLSTTCLAFCMGLVMLSANTAQAQEIGSLYYYDVPASEYQDMARYHEWQVFLQYQLNREPCQRYQSPPEGYVMVGCEVHRVGSVSTARTESVVTTVEPAPAAVVEETKSTYTVYFGFAKSNVADNEKEILGHAAQEIKKYNPSEVVVSGYASTPGSDGYNDVLSKKRAASVARELAENGVNYKVIQQRSYGEAHLAVPTADNVKMPPNRRVVIEFNH